MPTGYIVFIFNAKVCQCYHICCKTNFQGTLVLICLASAFGNFVSWKVIVGQRHLFWEKYIIYIGFVDVWIPVKLWNKYISHIFPMTLIQICWLETKLLCLNNQLSVNKNFQILIPFIKIKVTLWLLCAHPLMTCIIFHTLRPNSQGNISYVHGSCFSGCSLKARFPHWSISLQE